jgi:hypothetical protein
MLGRSLERRVTMTIGRRSTYQIVAAVALAAAIVAMPVRVVTADGDWLDGPQPQNWNTPGQAVPAPARPVNRAEIDARCLRAIRPPDTPEDEQVERQGCLLARWRFSRAA